MAKNLMTKIRKNRVAVPMWFDEITKDGKGRETRRRKIYPVYMSPFNARRVDPAVETYETNDVARVAHVG